jgi:hypothetical protein
MPVRKYRTIEEMNADEIWAPRLDPDNWRKVLSLTAFAYRALPWRFPPGVHKYRSIEDANRAREQWEEEATRRA